MTGKLLQLVSAGLGSPGTTTWQSTELTFYMGMQELPPGTVLPLSRTAGGREQEGLANWICGRQGDWEPRKRPAATSKALLPGIATVCVAFCGQAPASQRKGATVGPYLSHPKMLSVPRSRLQSERVCIRNDL